jgi:hypothetical protein
MELNVKFYGLMKLVVQKHLHVVNHVENYFHVVIINVQKYVTMEDVQSVYYYQQIVKHVLVEKQPWIINNDHHVLIQYD